MLRTLIVLAIFAGAAHSVARVRVRFDVNVFQYGKENFISVPTTAAEVTENSWVQYTPPSLPTGYEALTLHCPSEEDQLFCVYMDDTGYFAGFQASFDKNCISETAFDMKTQGFLDWTVTLTNGTIKNYYSTSSFTVTKEFLATDSATRIANRDTSVILQDTSVFVQAFNGDLYNISTDVSVSTGDDSIYTKQACIPLMGNHWYYNMTKDTECTSDKMFPWFITTYHDKITIVAKMVHLKYNCAHKWCESPAKSAVELIVTDGPQCLYDITESVGLRTMHVTFESPFWLNCLV